MEMKIEIIPPYKIAYIQHIGPYGNDNIQTMQKLKTWAKTNGLLHDNSIILGIAHDNPETTKPENCRYDTCLVISDNDCIGNNCAYNEAAGNKVAGNENVSVGSIVGGRYSIFKIYHTAEAVQQAWLEVFPELVKQGYTFDDTRTVLERYAVDMVNSHYCEICVPIK